MKKLLFLLGILFLLVGIGIYKPTDAEDILERANIRDLVWDNVREPLVTAYEENLKDMIALDIMSYLFMALGLLTIIISFRRKKKSMTGQLLYQQMEEVNPQELGEKAKKDQEKDKKYGIREEEERSIELPEISEPSGPGIPGAPPAAAYPPAATPPPGSQHHTFPAVTFSVDKLVNPLKNLFHKQGTPFTFGMKLKSMAPGKKFKCAACEDIFMVKHSENTVTCPSCNTSYKVR